MSDEHLAIILRGIQARLENALRQASDSLPEEERLMHMVHVADDCEPRAFAKSDLYEMS